MGQKSSPIILRKNYNYLLWHDNNAFPFYLLLQKLIIYFFQKKGLYINTLTLKKNANHLSIDVSFIVSRTSGIYTSKFRKQFFFKKKLKKKIRKKLSLRVFQRKFVRSKYRLTGQNKTNRRIYLKKFLKCISIISQINHITVRLKRLDKKIDRNLILNICNKSKKIGLNYYLRNKLFKNLIIILSLLLKSGTISSSLILLIISKHFTWIHKRKQRRFFTFLRDFFRVIFNIDQTYNKFLFGIKLGLNGKINGKDKASELDCIVGNMHSQTINVNIDSSQATTFNRLGTYGWKLHLAKSK